MKKYYVRVSDTVGRTLFDAGIHKYGVNQEQDLKIHDAPFSAGVFKEGDRVYAVNSNGKTIAEGEAGVDDASVIQKALDVGGSVFIKKGEYIIIAQDDPNNTDRAVGLFIPDNGVKIVGEDMTKTILKLKYTGARGRVDLISNKADTVDNPQIDGVTIKNLTLDGSLIDWYDWSAETGKYKYGEAIRLGISKRYFTNLVIKNIIVRSFGVGWGVAVGYTPDTTRHEYIRLENIRGEELGRGVVWVALANYVKANNIYGKNITGNNPDGEGHVYAQESGLFAEIESIRGESVAVAILNLSATLRCSVRGVKGKVPANGYLVRITNGSNIQVTDINALPESAGSGTCILLRNTNTDSYSITLDKITVYNCDRTIDCDPNGYKINHLTVSNILTNKPLRFVNVNELSVIGGCIYTGGADINLVDCSNVLLDLIYTTISKAGTVTFRRNSGTATITGDGTTTTFTVDITHGLAKDMVVAKITLDRDGTVDKVYLVDTDADGFKETLRVQVTFASAPADGEEVPIYWEAQVV
ncbi:MAG: hypothetical protein ACXQTR_00910 [Candidatus Methanospirareceae archaeon]